MLLAHEQGALMRRTAVLSFAAVLLIACQKSPGTDIWSCNNARKGACSQWSMASADDESRENHKASCERMGGRVIEGPCPHEDVVGSCVAGGGAESRIVYYAPRPVAEAKRACASLGGTWK
jgi:hypothetical protein